MEPPVEAPVEPPLEPDPGEVDRARRRISSRLFTLAGVLAAGAIVFVALMQLRSSGTNVISGVTVADYRASAQARDEPAPGFSLPALEGSGTISLRDYRGEIVVLNFWASWCLPCRQEAPGLRRVSERYENKGVQFLGVDYRDDRAAGIAFEKEFGIDYPSAFDPSGALAGDYRLTGLPTTFVIGPTGRIAFVFVGYTNEQLLTKAIEDLQGGN